MSFFACLLSVAAAVCVYLTANNQNLRSTPLPARWRIVGVVLGVLGCVLWTRVISTPSAVFASVSTLMTVWVLLPYLGWRLNAG